jgi:Ni/Co efflux regulator RcnB
MESMKPHSLLAILLLINLQTQVATAKTKPQQNQSAQPVIQNTKPSTTQSDDDDDNEEDKQAENEADKVSPKTPQNAFVKPDVDKIVKQQFDEDFWRIFKGGLPCLETSAACLKQLQDKSIAQSPLLKEIDNRIQEANQKIDEAKSRNQKSIKLSILSPALQYFLNPQTLNNGGGKTQSTGGLIDNIASLFTGKVSFLNGLLKVIGIPLFEGSQGGGDQAQSRAIQISDIQVKIAELQRQRAELADKIREKVATSLSNFDQARTEFQESQVMAARTIEQFQLYEIAYRQGDSDTQTYLSRLNALDHTKVQTFSSWSKMKRSLFEIKMLVLNTQEADN